MTRCRVYHKPIARASRDRRTFRGVVYHSRDEMIRATELDLLVRAGAYRVTRQPKVALGLPKNEWTLDFEVECDEGEYLYRADGEVVEAQHWFEDVTGFETAEKRRWIELWRDYGPCLLVLMKRKGDGWVRRVVIPGPPGRKE